MLKYNPDRSEIRPFDPRTDVSADARHVAGRIVKHLWIIFVALPFVLAMLFVILKSRETQLNGCGRNMQHPHPRYTTAEKGCEMHTVSVAACNTFLLSWVTDLLNGPCRQRQHQELFA